MYLVLSMVIALITAYALSAFYSFGFVFLLSFFIVLCLSCFIDTIATESNRCFDAGCSMISSGELWYYTWWISLLPIWLFLTVGIIGAFLLAPIWYFIEHTSSSVSSKVFLWIVIILLPILYVCGIVLLISPIMIYRIIHYGWIIGIFIGVAIIGLIITIVLQNINAIQKKSGAFMIVGSVGLIPLMICGVVFSLNATYHISSFKDMYALANAPTTSNTVFVLDNNIDFSEKDVGWFGGKEIFEGVFDGQGYTLSNIALSAECKSTDVVFQGQGFGFVRKNEGIIRNLKFENCKITVQNKPDVTDAMYFGIIAGCNEGKICDCIIINCQAKYRITENISVYAGLSTGSKGDRDDVIIISEYDDEAFYTEGEFEWHKVSK